MTDHPRFENSAKNFEQSFARSHGGGLVAIVLSWADQWQRRRDAIRLRERPQIRDKLPVLRSR